MKKIAFAMMLFTICPLSLADTKITVGGTLVKDSSTVITTSTDHSKEYGRWQHSLESNYVYNEKNNIRTRNEGYFSFKENYSLDEKNYIIGWVRYDHDEFRYDPNRTTVSLGYGYKILRTDTVKISNELTAGQMNHSLGWSDVISNSLWVSYKVAKRITAVNKLFVDWADQQYVRNRTELNYQLEQGIILSLTNLYTRDPIDDNITTFNIGTSF